MTARPPESPIDVSSNSPTPTRPLSLPRRSSSRLRDTHEPIGAAVSHTRSRQVPEEDEEVMPVPPPRPRERYSLPPASHRPAPNHHRPAAPRHGLAIPTAAAAGPSRAAEVIDLTEDDDDDIEFTGEAPIPATRRVAADPRLHQRQRGAEIRARIAAETERHRQFGRQGQGHEAYDVNAWRDLNR
jgi:single-stranded DNA-binding protein